MNQKKELIAKLKGGLGNQLFQYAAGRALSRRTNADLLLDLSGYDSGSSPATDTPRSYRLSFFNIKAEIASAEKIHKTKYPLGIVSKGLRFFNQKVLKKHNFDYDPRVFSSSAPYLEGYFQSEKNFIDIEQDIRSEITLKPEFESQKFKDARSKIASTPSSVSVHIRRGDYVQDAKTNAHHGTCSKDYYANAMRLVAEHAQNPTFFFFSDDIEWVKKEFSTRDNHVFVSEPGLEEYEELMLMSACSHNIIANSSFSWWGAWLNPNPSKIVVAPSRWTNDSDYRHPNIVPASWTRI